MNVTAQSCEETILHGSKYVERRKELLALVNQLHSIGARDVIDLPRITVIGEQSAGKSSVVEAISGIKVPRDAGTCTRCPLECRLKSTPLDIPWSCRVFIRWDSTINNIDAREPEVQFGKIIMDKSKVEEALRRAQYACLHAPMPLERALHMPLEQTKIDNDSSIMNGTGKGTGRVGFSRHVVCVDIQGPGLPDLSFIDLPGLIQNAESEDVQLVEDLVMSNIQGNCLILVTMPATDDIENQKALRLAQRVDPGGRRTIGVLTKPDLLSASSTNALKIWVDILEGRKHQLKHGYYCVKQPDDADREAGISSMGAREVEERFFEASELCTSVGDRTKNRLGTNKLIDAVGELLVQVIDESLPKIRAEASQNLEACEHELQSLPPVLDIDPSAYMLTTLSSLSNDFIELVRGGPDNSRLIQGNRVAFEDFKNRIKGTSPNFLAQPNPKKPRLINATMEELICDGAEFTLNDMKEHIARSVTRELRGNIPHQAKIKLITAFQKKWPNHMMECYGQVRTSLTEVLYDCVKKSFAQHDGVLAPLRSYVDELVQSQYTKCLEFLDASLEVEQSPFTQNDHYLDSSTEEWLGKYKEERAQLKGKTKSSQAKTSANNSTKGTPKTASKSLYEDLAAASPCHTQSEPLPLPISRRKLVSPFGTSSTQSSSSSSRTATTGAQPSGTSIPPYTAHLEPDSYYSLTLQYQSIMPAYVMKSVEELRVEDYKQGVTGPTFVFGSAPSAWATTPGKPFWDTPTAQQGDGFGYKPAQSSTSSGKDREKVTAALAMLASLGYTGLTEEDLGRLNPADQYETELKVMAEVRGYFQVSYKRVIDNIPSLIDLKFVKAIGKELQPFLVSKFELGSTNGNDRCAAYLAEEPDVKEIREQLLARKRRLEKVQVELFNFAV